VVLIPPEELWPAIQHLRAEHDKHASRWMPHVTLLYGFVPEEHFEAAAALAAEALASFDPFTVRMEKLDLFRHRGSCTLWARPDSRPPQRLKDVQQALQAAFPRCDEQSRHSESGFTPHLSLGQSDVRSAAETLAAWQRDWSPLEFEVREVQLISRRGDEPFEVRYSVSLGGGSKKSAPRGDALQRWLDENATPTAEESARREEAVAHVSEACAAVLGSAEEHGPSVHVLGSAALGVSLPGSDVDLLCLGPEALPRARFFEEVALLLSSAGVLTRSRAVLDAENPVLKLELGDTRVDLQYARLPPGVPLTAPEALDSAVHLRLEPDSQRALVGFLEAGELLARVRETPGEEPFRRVLRAVRAWAPARGVSSNALGYLGGFSWAVLVAHACVHAPEAAREDPSALLEHFFSTYARWKWPEPVALTEMARLHRPERRDLMPVLTLLPPVANSARNVSRSTLALLRDEWTRGEALTKRARSGAGSWEALFEPLDPLAQGEHFLLIGMRARTEDDLAACMGWLDSFVVGLVVALDTRTPMQVRPFPGHRRLRTEEDPVGAILFGLDRPGSAELDTVIAYFRISFFERWTERPEGSEFSYEVLPRARLLERLKPGR
jgi:poly(A) polymerase